jgi:DegV family protein with EDD domain
LSTFKIVVDSTFYLSEEELKRYDIRRASLNLIDESSSHRELDIQNDYVYEALKACRKLSTSQPSPAEFLRLYNEAIDAGADTIFVLTLAPPLSGTYQSAEFAKKMLDNPEKVHLFKSRLAAIGNEMLALELAEMIEKQLSKESIIQRMNQLIMTGHINFTIENLIHLMRSGRLSKTKALIGTVLRVKPLLEQDSIGRLTLHGSARTHKKVMEMMINNIKQTTVDAKQIIIRLVSKNADNHVKVLKDLVQSHFPKAKLTINYYVGPVFSLHLGTNAYGLAWCNE